MFSSLKIAEVLGVLAVVAAAALFYHMWQGQVVANGGLQHSIDTLTHAAQDKANAQKSRSTIEQRNNSADYPSLIDKL